MPGYEYNWNFYLVVQRDYTRTASRCRFATAQTEGRKISKVIRELLEKWVKEENQQE
jgi:hypothetical protein